MGRRAGGAVLSLVLALALVVSTQTAASSLAEWHEPPPLDVPLAQVSSDSCPWMGTVVRTQKFSAEQTGSLAFGHRWTHVVAHSTAPVDGQTCGTSWRAWDKETQWEVDTSDPDCTRTRDVAGEGFSAGTGALELSIGGGVGDVWHARVVALGGEYHFPGSETRNNCGETTTTSIEALQFANVTDDDDCSWPQVSSGTVQAFRFTCVQDFPEETVDLGDGSYTSRYRWITEGTFRRTACDMSVDTDAGGVADCLEYDAGTDPSVAADDRVQPSPTPTPAPTEPCPAVKPLAPALHVAASGTVGSREVSFQLISPVIAPGYGYRVAYGDGTSEPISAVGGNAHTYPQSGEYEATLVMTYPPGCVSDPRTFDVVADPVGAYAPSIHLHPDEKYFPDSVSRFLSAAVLIHDLPNYDSGGGGPLSRARCRDEVLARGASADLGQLADARPSTQVPRRVPVLSRARLGGRSGSDAYRAREHEYTTRYGCLPTRHRYRAHQAGAMKTGSSKSRDDGLVLSLAGASSSVLRGDTSFRRAKLYVDYRQGRYIAYWIWYPYNSWRSNPGPITERHEGDWEHVTVKLDSFSGLMTTVGYYQHYCAAKLYSRHELLLESGTHPPVWPAKGGHASYQKNVGRKTVGSCWKGGPNGPTDTTGAGGRIWRTWKPTAAGGSALRDVRLESWYGFEGAWGDPREADFANYGPQAPGGQAGGLPAGW